jgi:hypothetical protein
LDVGKTRSRRRANSRKILSEIIDLPCHQVRSAQQNLDAEPDCGDPFDRSLWRDLFVPYALASKAALAAPIISLGKARPAARFET